MIWAEPDVVVVVGQFWCGFGEVWLGSVDCVQGNGFIDQASP